MMYELFPDCSTLCLTNKINFVKMTPLHKALRSQPHPNTLIAKPAYLNTLSQISLAVNFNTLPDSLFKLMSASNQVVKCVKIFLIRFIYIQIKIFKLARIKVVIRNAIS